MPPQPVAGDIQLLVPARAPDLASRFIHHASLQIRRHDVPVHLHVRSELFCVLAVVPQTLRAHGARGRLDFVCRSGQAQQLARNARSMHLGSAPRSLNWPSRPRRPNEPSPAGRSGNTVDPPLRRLEPKRIPLGAGAVGDRSASSPPRQCNPSTETGMNRIAPKAEPVIREIPLGRLPLATNRQCLSSLAHEPRQRPSPRHARHAHVGSVLIRRPAARSVRDGRKCSFRRWNGCRQAHFPR